MIVDAFVAGDKPSLSFKLPAAGDRMVITEYPPNSGSERLTAGSVVQVEFWEGRVTLIAGGATAENPANNQGPWDVLVIATITALIGVAFIAWAIYSWRRPPSDTDRPHSAGSMNPVAASQLLNNQ